MKLGAVLVIPLTAATLAACGTPAPGADRASAVAEAARCGDLEELDAGSDAGPWVYTCQIGDRTYSLRVFGSEAGAQGDPASANLERVVRGRVVVLQARGEGASAPAYDYSAFR